MRVHDAFGMVRLPCIWYITPANHQRPLFLFLATANDVTSDMKMNCRHGFQRLASPGDSFTGKPILVQVKERIRRALRRPPRMRIGYNRLWLNRFSKPSVIL